MRRPSFAPALALLALLAAAPAHAEELKLTLLHTTDLHGALAAWDEAAARPAAKGLVKIASLVREARAEGHPVLLLDAGDACTGSGLTRFWRAGDRARPEPVTAAMNALGYDAMAVGNHEFDFGPAGLDSLRAAAHFPFLAANVVNARTGAPAFPGTHVFELDGVRVGVLGLCTPAVPQLGDPALTAGLAFLSPVEVAAREVPRLRSAERCDVVVVLAHTGLERDPAAPGGDAPPPPGVTPNENLGWRLAYEVPGIDVLVLGHTHVVIPSVTIGGTLVTQAGRFGEGLGRVDLTLARDTNTSPWRLTARAARYLPVTDATPADAALDSLVAPYAQVARESLDVVEAQALGEFAARFGRFTDSPLWRLIQRAQLETTGADVSLAALPDPAQRIAAGPVRVRDLLRLYPYDNTLAVVEMSGADLKAALEHAASLYAPYTDDGVTPLLLPGAPGFQLDMAYGVGYEVDLTRPAGDRIQSLTFQGKPLDPAQRLKVAVNSYRLAGAGGYEAVHLARRVWSTQQTIPALLARWVRGKGALDPRGEPAWTLVPDYAAAPERPLVDRLVREGVAPAAEVRHLGAFEPVRRVDVAYWLGRAFGWRSRRPSGAWPDVPDALEPWLDGILARGVLGAAGSAERFDPFRLSPLQEAVDWSERAARAAGYALTSRLGDPSFRRGLLTGVSVHGAASLADTLTRAQWLGIVSNLRFPGVRLLETTDFHGMVLDNAKDRRSGRPIGGTPALAATIERERAANPEGTVLLDGGDLFQGTMLSNLQFGRPVVEQMNALGYAAAAVGNHEFDWGVDTLVRRVHAMRFAELAANLVQRRGGRLPPWVRADTLLARRGVRVGVLGLAYPGTPRVTLAANVAQFRFDDDSTTAARLAPRLRRQGADLVVEVGHIPAETDSTRHARGDLARLAGTAGVDVWFGGHSHNVVDDRIGGHPVMIAGAHGEWLAEVDAVVDPVKHRVVETTQRMLPVWGDVAVDSAWTARVAAWNAGVGPVAAEVLGRASVALHRRRPEATIGDFITDAMRAASGADIALQNPGGMRADLAAGDVTRGAIYEVMPFDNTIVTERLTGAEVKLALEQALRYDRVTQVSGLRYAFDPSRPEGSRVTAVTLEDGAPLDDAKLYEVAVNNFMATGGDHYDVLGSGRDLKDTGRVIRAAMEDYVRAQSRSGGALAEPGDGRVKRAGGGGDER